MRISDWSSDVCSSDLARLHRNFLLKLAARTLALFGRQALPIIAGDIHGIVRAPFVEPPGFAAFDVQGEHVHGVEMRVEALAGITGAVGVAGNRPARTRPRDAGTEDNPTPRSERSSV